MRNPPTLADLRSEAVKGFDSAYGSEATALSFSTIRDFVGRSALARTNERFRFVA